MNIKHRKSKPLDNNHPAVLAVLEHGISAPIFTQTSFAAVIPPVNAVAGPSNQPLVNIL